MASAITSPYAVVASLSCAAFMLLGLLITAFSEDNRILISSDGLTLPYLMGLKMRGRRVRSWTELTRTDVVNDGAGNARMLLLGFGDGALLPLKISAVTSQELEQFLVAVELWAPAAERSVELSEFQARLQNRSVGLETLSYTKMWEDEMSRRFTATTFVPLEPGRTLQNKKYKVVRQIAFGGFAAIYLAQRSGLDMVVLKQAVLPPETDPTTRSVAEQHLRRESQMLFKLDHPGIVRVYDFFVEDGNYFLVMEHISGQDLRQFIKQHGAQSAQTVANWARQLAATLEFLHTQEPPIVHRDASPDNIVLANDGSLRLIDFGASTEFVTNATGTVIGKQAYTSPEQLRGRPCVQSDVYALGATMHYCLTGKDPLALSQSHPAESVPGLQCEMDELVADCTAFELSERIDSMRELRDRLSALKETANLA
jgi:tRNA A-37 threonylcarbamoyl transferase component Bud32